MDSIGRQARVAGLLYLIGGVTAPFSLLYVPQRLIVPGDAAATVDHLRASATLLSLGMASELFVATMFVFVALALYRLLRRVDEGRALAMLVLLLLSVPISFVTVLADVAALTLANGAAFLSVFDSAQRGALALLFLRLHGQGIFLAEFFWGLWLFPFGVLVIRSGFLPRVLGFLLLVAGCGYVAVAAIALFLPTSAHPIARFASLLTIGEFPIALWLVIRGAKAPRGRALAPVSS
jgi:Domain of unknown function (DUF4386)